MRIARKRISEMKYRLFSSWLIAVAAFGAHAETAAPLAGPKPVFTPGMYENESRNARFQNQGVKSKVCIASADFDAFERETLEQYRKSPQFMKACRLSPTKPLSDGFAFAMDCRGDKTIIDFHFSKDFVSSTIRTLIAARPEFSSEILTLSRRVGDCPGQKPVGRDL
jgi:hypothetical protein